VALQLAERGFFVKELNVGWKEWTYNRHQTHPGPASIENVRGECSK